MDNSLKVESMPEWVGRVRDALPGDCSWSGMKSQLKTRKSAPFSLITRDGISNLRPFRFHER